MAGSIPGDLLAAGLGYAGSKMQLKQQEKFYKHRYQWMRSDLEAAGLNPMLAFGSGTGAVPPIGPNPLEGASESARGMAHRVSELRSMDAQRQNMRADTNLKYSTADLNAVQRQLSDQLWGYIRPQEYSNLLAQNDLLVEQARTERARQDELHAGAYERYWAGRERELFSPYASAGGRYYDFVGPVGYGIEKGLGMARDVLPWALGYRAFRAMRPGDKSNFGVLTYPTREGGPRR